MSSQNSLENAVGETPFRLTASQAAQPERVYHHKLVFILLSGFAHCPRWLKNNALTFPLQCERGERSGKIRLA